MTIYVSDHRYDIENILDSEDVEQVAKRVVDVLLAMNDDLANLDDHVDEMRGDVDAIGRALTKLKE